MHICVITATFCDGHFYVRRRLVISKTLFPLKCATSSHSNIRLQSGSVPIEFCLLNTRSIHNKELALKDYATENDLG